VLHQIELNLRDINQLFNTIDPSPFPDRDLDRSAEDFIVSWAQEFPIDEPVGLIIYLKKPPEGHRTSDLVVKAIHNYFTYRARLNHLEFKRLMRQGRTSLMVGFARFCSARAHHRRVGGDVATDGNLSLRLVAVASSWKDFRQAEQDARRSSQRA
jgi:hypothetical protein